MMDDKVLFNRSGPFYPYVAAYWASLHGFTDLMSRRLVDVATSASNGRPVAVKSGDIDLTRL